MNVRNRIGYAICIIIGLIFAGLGIFGLMQNASFKKNGVKTTAEVLSITEEYDGDDTVYYIRIKYIANGKEYQTVIEDFFDYLQVGEKVKIFYLPSEPNSVLVERIDNVFPIAITCVGTIVLLVGISSIISYYRKKKLNQYLMREGVCRTCEITYFTHAENRESSVKKRKALRVFNTLTDYTVKLICKDEYGNVYKERFYMELCDAYVVGDNIYVYVHPTNPKKYFIDRASYLENLELKGANAN